MGFQYSVYKALVRSLFSSFLICLWCIALTHSSKFLEYFFTGNHFFFEDASRSGVWKADISSIESGNYYISLGRPRTTCAIEWNGNIVATNKSSINYVRESLLLGVGIVIDSTTKKEPIFVKCDYSSVPLKLSHQPILASLSVGQIIHAIRGFTELLMGPLSGVAIVLLFIFSLSSNFFDGGIEFVKSKSKKDFEGFSFFVFGIAAFIYSVSLAHFFRLIFDSSYANAIHVVSRCFLGLSFIVLFTRRLRGYKYYLHLQTVIFLVSIFLFLFRKSLILDFYLSVYPVFALITGLAAVESFFSVPKSKAELILRDLLTSWTVIQIIDYIALRGAVGIYLAPSVAVTLSFMAIYLRELERRRTEKVENAAARILKSIQNNSDPKEILKELSLINKKETGFSRVSAYIDAFCVGGADSPNKIYFRVIEDGYHKDTKNDLSIDMSQGKGQQMSRAINLQKPLLSQGYKGAWYLVVPIGQFACINLSDEKPRVSYFAFDAEELINRIFPSLQTLIPKLLDYAVKQSSVLQKIRYLRGEGKWDEEIGCIFVDINDYSKTTDQFGDVFSSFVSQVYIPALIKAVSISGTPEHIGGDEVYFVIIKDLLQANSNIKDATLKALEKIDDFVYNDGARICASNGFPAITLSIGVNFGVATVVVDSVGVRTSGKEVIETKRLVVAAGKESILTKESCAFNFNGSRYSFGEPIVIQKKKNLIFARKILRLRTSEKVVA